MKILTKLLGLMLFLSAVAFSQTAADSTRKQESHKSGRIVDENGDGVSDRMMERQPSAKRRMDHFIDSNGDGISDNRECAFGFRRGMMQQTGAGKQGMGKGQKGK